MPAAVKIALPEFLLLTWHSFALYRNLFKLCKGAELRNRNIHQMFKILMCIVEIVNRDSVGVSLQCMNVDYIIFIETGK